MADGGGSPAAHPRACPRGLGWYGAEQADRPCDSLLRQRRGVCVSAHLAAPRGVPIRGHAVDVAAGAKGVEVQPLDRHDLRRVDALLDGAESELICVGYEAGQQHLGEQGLHLRRAPRLQVADVCDVRSWDGEQRGIDGASPRRVHVLECHGAGRTPFGVAAALLASARHVRAAPVLCQLAKAESTRSAVELEVTYRVLLVGRTRSRTLRGGVGLVEVPLELIPAGPHRQTRIPLRMLEDGLRLRPRHVLVATCSRRRF
mmetsp:Transcript_121898/g.351989  ORF Transcript_121898/g.351989 Transcript_121898/m.351989 type:complete len:259 (-) Transcript_121898:488-1264(-)